MFVCVQELATLVRWNALGHVTIRFSSRVSNSLCDAVFFFCQKLGEN